ncbi:MAG TPA: carboxypeptidase-like regulatory domain-containing protein, partial [Pyrinomonadaceae bacterium]|nr:carboxypeptidase-like regulatory domain-containing protein [Pyrinomonadaceae bacterium]
MKFRKLFHLFVLIAAAILIAQPSLAQSRIGTVQGTIKDPTGALIPGAEVTITQPLTHYKQTAQTDRAGTFKLVNIPFNTYTVTVKAEGFQPTEEHIDLESTIPLSLD